MSKNKEPQTVIKKEIKEEPSIVGKRVEQPFNLSGVVIEEHGNVAVIEYTANGVKKIFKTNKEDLKFI